MEEPQGGEANSSWGGPEVLPEKMIPAMSPAGQEEVMMGQRHSQGRKRMSKAEMRSSMAWHAQGAPAGYITGVKNLTGRVAGFWCGQGQISRALHAMVKTLDLVLLNLTLMVEGRTGIYCLLPCDKPSIRCLTWVISIDYLFL